MEGEGTLTRSLKIILLTLALLAGAPALAEPEQHRHGQETASPAMADKGAAPGHDHDMAGRDAKGGMDNLKAGGKSCKKCRMGMGGHADTENLEFRVGQLEKRQDLMQSMLEALVERRGGGHR